MPGASRYFGSFWAHDFLPCRFATTNCARPSPPRPRAPRPRRLALGDLAPDRLGEMAQHRKGVAQDRWTPDNPVVGLQSPHHVAGDSSGPVVKGRAPGPSSSGFARPRRSNCNVTRCRQRVGIPSQSRSSRLGAAVDRRCDGCGSRRPRHHEDPAVFLSDQTATDFGERRDGQAKLTTATVPAAVASFSWATDRRVNHGTTTSRRRPAFSKASETTWRRWSRLRVEEHGVGPARAVVLRSSADSSRSC